MMRILDKVDSEKLDKIKEKRKNKKTCIQVQIPSEVHLEVGNILRKRKISWQKALMAAIYTIRDESIKGT